MQARNMIGLSTWKVFKRRATGYDVPWEAFPGVACRSLCYTIFYILGDYYVDYMTGSYAYIATDKYLEHHLEKILKIVTAGMF